MSLAFISSWSLIRLSGFLAYFLLTLSLAFGLLARMMVFRKDKPLMLALHQTSGWAGFLTIIFHSILLWKDAYVPYSLLELVLPFSAQNAPILSALGTLSFYLFLMTMAASDFFIKKLGRSVWKRLHLLVIPAWLLMVLHGILIGTDSTQPWAAFLYGGGFILILALLALRYAETMLHTTAKKIHHE
ncbi:ferric reductase-like transmembrane domain-containing protein [Bacillus tuaregi]|uniref:ferric reductase-like transmembrane domain-containing protein n=1 Tax=Bacillus tuaregi TaxID=1816695 RepID=UPI0008F8563E|nr:ferric reductase-like transmembrane domain-containing protein [Bacillus tuaregi]